jgi:hypothetical protein
VVVVVVVGGKGAMNTSVRPACDGDQNRASSIIEKNAIQNTGNSHH